MFEIGQIITKENYTEAAVWCNANGAHIEKQNGQYVIVKNAPAPEPTSAERVAALEAQTGLTRAVRELVLAEGSGVSDYVKSKAQEIEALAAPMRQTQEPATEETPEADTGAAEVAESETPAERETETEATVSEMENVSPDKEELETEPATSEI